MTSSTSKTILVTGATGFIGAEVCAALLDNGHRVIGIGRSFPGHLDPTVCAHPQFSLIQNILEDLSVFPFADAVVHLASTSPFRATLETLLKGNTLLTQVVSKLANKAGIAQVIFVSTTAVWPMYSTKTILSPGLPEAPGTYYGVSKLAAEKVLNIELEGSPIQRSILRFPSVFGQHHRGGLMYTYYELAATGQDITVFGNGAFYRNLLYISDACRSILATIERKEQLPSTYLAVVGSRDSLRMGEIATVVRDKLKSPSAIILSDSPLPVGGDIWIDPSPIQTDLGVDPLSIADGIDAYIKEMIAS